MNIRVDILSRKNYVDTKDDKKDIKMLKNKLWTKRIHMEAKEEITLLKEIQKNNIREQKVLKELEKDDRQA